MQNATLEHKSPHLFYECQTEEVNSLYRDQEELKKTKLNIYFLNSLGL